MCSRVCGMTESSAATTSMARSRPEAPASMLRMNRSWPGTSIKASVIFAQVERREAQVDRDAALLFGGQAIGVDAGQARTRAVLPWSMWPAVPRMKFIIVSVVSCQPIEPPPAAPSRPVNSCSEFMGSCRLSAVAVIVLGRSGGR